MKEKIPQDLLELHASLSLLLFFKDTQVKLRQGFFPKHLKVHTPSYWFAVYFAL